ncbi:MAG: peptidase [Alteromonadaceae bacterium]|nr:MAG: peptidase [Alteromonadaceae bacterium]
MSKFLYLTLSLILLLNASYLSAEETSVVAKIVAKPLDIKGDWVQGGLLHGQTVPGNTVTVFGHSASVDERGRFIFGLGRDTKKRIDVEVKTVDGQSRVYPFDVEQREYDIQRIEGVAKKYVAPPKSVSKRISTEAAQVKKARKVLRDAEEFRQGFTWPLIGRITGVYGSQRVFNGVPKRPHYGLDIAGPIGATVVAPAPGVVTLAHENMYYSGGTLIVDHGQGLSSTFIHLSKILVKVGDPIVRGQAIAEVGASGRVTGPHLDWRMNWKNQRIDPFLLVPPMPES